MGTLGAQAFAEQVDEGNVSLRAALSWHVRANHYPPLPEAHADVAVRVIDWVRGCDPDDPETWDTLIDLPVGLNPLPREVSYTDVEGVEIPQARVGTLVEILHLDAFLYTDDEEGV